jgi:filamentous hemagglutinin family protein
MRTKLICQLGRSVSLAALGAMLAWAPQKAHAQAFQGTPTVNFGTASINRSTPGVDNIAVTSNTGRATITWTPSDTATGGGPINFLPGGNSVNFANSSGQPTATVLNRIIPTDTSRAAAFNGQVNSTPDVNVWFYSPGGLLIGSTARFNVGGLLLTAADPVVNGSNDFMANAGQFAVAGTPGSTSAVVVEAGVEVRAESAGKNNYIVAVAPRIQQDGLVSARGAVALVAAESADFVMDSTGLFNISVTQGTQVASNTFAHTGQTGGPGQSANGLNRRVYMVAVPKNNAITMAIQSGGQIGFDVAGAADVDGNAIVLSAGHNIQDSGRGNPIVATPAGIGNADLTIGAGTYSSNTFAAASNDVSLAGNINGGGSINLSVNAGKNLQVNGTIADTNFPSHVRLRADHKGTGIGTVTFGGAGQISLNPAGSAVDIYYNPVALGSPANYSANVVNATLTAYQLVRDATQLQTIGSYLNQNFALSRDIDASATASWNSGLGFVPIGNSGAQFTGNFDGLGYAITGLTINRPGQNYVGLFGSTLGSKIRDVGLISGSVTGGYYTGGLIGAASGGQLSGLFNSGTVFSGQGDVGGVVGNLNSGAMLTNSHASSTVTVTGGQFSVGGLVGYNGGAISRSWATGNVSLDGAVRGVGGLVGFNDGTIDQSYATGNVTGSPDIYGVGGLVGYIRGGAVTNSYATGAVNGADSVGGFVGYIENGFASFNYATGPVTGLSNVGGFAGLIYDGVVDFSYWDSFRTGQAASYGDKILGTITNLNDVTSDPAQFAAPNFALSSGAYGNFDLTNMWRIYDGYTAPLLKTFLRPLAVGASPLTTVYNAALPAVSTVVPLGTDPAHLFGTTTFSGLGINAGLYSVSYGGGLYSDQQGYDINAISAPAVVRITQAPLTVTAFGASRIYGNANPVLTYTTSGLRGSDILAGTPLSTANPTSNIGTYAITQGTLNNPNYAITFLGANLTVTPRPLSVSANSASRLYGAANPAFTYTANGLVNGDTLTGSLASAAGASSNLGTYAINQGTLASSTNYTLSFTGNTLTVNQRPITVTADTLSRYYGDANPALTYSVGGSGLANGDTLGGGLATTANLTSNVGSYAVTQGTLSASANYAMTFNGANLSVTRRPLTITADALSRNYGDANPALTYALGGSGLINGDKLSGELATEASASSGVGTYAVTQGTLSISSNYAVTYNGANLTVKGRPITITADALSRHYGDANPALTYALSGAGLINNDKLSGELATTASASSGVGTYAVTQGTLSASPNYAVTYNGANLSVTQRPITITADALSRNYGEANPALTYSVGGLGLVNGDTLTGALATAANSTSPGGKYAIDQGSLAASPNYLFTYVGANLTVSASLAQIFAPMLMDVTKMLGSTVQQQQGPSGGMAEEAQPTDAQKQEAVAKSTGKPDVVVNSVIDLNEVTLPPPVNEPVAGSGNPSLWNSGGPQ